VEFRINKGALGLSKDVTHHVLEYQSPTIAAHATRSFTDLHRDLQVPVMPPTMADICRVIEIFYTLKVKLPVLQYIIRLNVLCASSSGRIKILFPDFPAAKIR